MARPRKISEEEAIDRALRVFWEYGYERASVALLSEALEVGPSGLYNAFGSKAELFRQAIQHYTNTFAGFATEISDRDLDVEEVVRTLLREAAKAYLAPDTPPGCAVMQSAGAASAEQSEAASITLEVKAGLEVVFRRMLDRASKRHGTKLAAPSRVLAKYLIATMRGLSQLAIDGASLRELNKVADVAAGACVD